MLYQFLLYNEVKQLYVYIYIYIYPLPLGSPSHLPLISLLQVITVYRAELPVLKVGSYLSLLHMVVYLCQCYSLSLSSPPLPHSTSKCPFSSSMYFPALQIGSSVLFFQISYIYIYVLIYDMFFLFLFTSLHMTDSRYICCLTI